MPINDPTGNPAGDGRDFFRGQPGPQNAAGKRGLIARVTSAINAFLAKEEVPFIELPPEGRTTEIGAAEAAYTSFNNPLWRVQYDRKAVYFDLKDMDRNDPIISTALDVHADCAVGYEDTAIDGFEWIMEVKNDEALQLLQDLKKRLNLGAEVWQIVRNFVKNGEEYRELVVDEAFVVQRFKSLPSYQIAPVMDQYGNKQPGWTQKVDGFAFQKPILFEEWEIISFIYGNRWGYYGTGLMVPARRAWKRLTKMEDGMVLARLVRAYDKHLHRIPVGERDSPQTIQDRIRTYKENMTKRKGLDQDNLVFMRENPLQVETDFYIPDDGSGKGGIEVLEARNQQLQNIDDVRYHQELLLARLKVPRKYLNLSSGKTGALMDGGLEAEDKQFARALRQEQAVLRQGLIRLATTALALQGFNADELGVGVDLPKISTEDMLTDAKIQLANAQAANFFAQALNGLPPELVADKFMELDKEDKEILGNFVSDRKAMAPTNPVAGPAGAARGRPAGVEGDGASPDEVVQTIAKLKGAVQRALTQQYSVQFNVGHAENVAHVRQALLDELAL